MHSCIAPMSMGMLVCMLPMDMDFIISIVSTSISRSRLSRRYALLVMQYAPRSSRYVLPSENSLRYEMLRGMAVGERGYFVW